MEKDFREWLAMRATPKDEKDEKIKEIVNGIVEDSMPTMKRFTLIYVHDKALFKKMFAGFVSAYTHSLGENLDESMTLVKDVAKLMIEYAEQVDREYNKRTNGSNNPKG